MKMGSKTIIGITVDTADKMVLLRRRTGKWSIS